MERALKNWSVKQDDISMQAGLQAHIAFHLGGMRPRGELDTVDELGLRPALFAGYRDLGKLRYDFPLVLIRGGAGAASVQSLSGLFDGSLKEIATGADGERLRKHALRLEREIRALAAECVGAALSDLWDQAAERLSAKDDELLQNSLGRLRAVLKLDGEVVDCDQAMPFRLCHHLWQTVHDQKTRRFQGDIGRLVVKLSDILRADFVRSPEGLSAQTLKASMGGADRDAFDFEALSRLLAGTSPKASLPESRCERIRWLLSVLESQRFYPALSEGDTSSEDAEPYGIVFENCADAVAAYRELLPKMIELAKAIAMAELEIEGEYNESRHDAFFANFGADGLDPGNFELFPDYLIRVHAADMQAADNDAILEAFAAGLRAKVLVQTDDILEPLPIVGGNLAFGLRSKQLAITAIGLSGFYVLQSSSSNLLRFRERLFRGLTYPGPALFSVFSGASGNGLPPYLNAAAAMESRAFPAFAYDPSAGPDWASRFYLEDNPQADLDWPVHSFAYEDEAHQRISEHLAFTLVDFVACDRRHARHFARVPRAKWNGSMVPACEFLAPEPKGLSDKVPCLLMVDPNDVLQKVIVDDKLVREARRCAEMWRSLQELGGIHNSHAARLLAQERKAWEAQSHPATETRGNGPAPASVTPAVAPAAPATVPESTEPERSSDDPYIETARCTTCDECTQINDKMFAYDANKQASIVNPDAGTYRQLVEAAESCQVSIIHPGKPRNPNEPGLDELQKRAEPFL
ncbi:MAG: ferredoxin [Bauldia sp.]|nr:ferredoxin [Bauldia sp.]